MCLIAFAWQTSTHYPLILIGNRDEFHARPTRPATFWTAEGHPELLAGKDIEAGGTWLGVTRSGRFAALTNIRAPGPFKGPRSRGQLVLDYLSTEQPPADYIASLAAHTAEYAGFNLLVGDREQLWFLNSRDAQPRQLSAGVYGLSNANLDSPWPKTVALRNALASNPDAGNEQLLQLLANDQPYPDDQLPDTGINKEWERMLSPAFIIGNDDYGTRACSILRIDKQGEITFFERRFGPLGRLEGEISLRA